MMSPNINNCHLSWGSGSAAKNIYFKQIRSIRVISWAGHNAHTEPLFKIYRLLIIEDISIQLSIVSSLS